jgi:hypothetical protein
MTVPAASRERLGKTRFPRVFRQAQRSDLPPARPALLPVDRWARVALLLLLAFTLFRGLLWADFMPAFWGPDEDYHFLYADHIVTQGSLPDPSRPLYPVEYSIATDSNLYNAYGSGPRTQFDGDPHASLDQVSALPDSAREPTGVGRGVGVVHPPLYHVFAAAADWMTGDAPMQTRLTWVRYVTALFGVLAVYAAWLLAAQALRRESHQLFVAFMVAIQPMVGFLSGIANHDSALIAFFTAAVAFMLFALRAPPRPAQGAWLGGAVALALLVKGSALALLPLAAVTYAAQALTWRAQWREVLKAMLVAAAVVAVVAGWWYVRSMIVYGTTTGAIAPAGAVDPGGSASLSQLYNWTKEWTGLTYRTYWWHYVFWEAPVRTFWYYVPALIGCGGGLGLLGAAWTDRRHLFDPANPRLRQIVVMIGAVLAPFLSFLAVDLQRRTDGAGFYVNGGRYLLPAYAAAVTLFVIGLLHLVKRPARPLVFGAVGAIATYFSLHVFEVHYLHRYFGDEGIGELLRRVSFDRPAFVTPVTLGVLLGLVVLSFAAFAVALVRASRDPAPAHE